MLQTWLRNIGREIKVTQCKDHLDKQQQREAGPRCSSGSAIKFWAPDEGKFCLTEILSNKITLEIMNIWNSYIWTAEWRNKCKEDPRSY